MKVVNLKATPLIYGDGKTIDGLGVAIGNYQDFKPLIDKGLVVVKEEAKKQNRKKTAQHIPSVEPILEDDQSIIPSE